MILNANDHEHRKFKIYDCMGTVITGVIKYDTVTKEAEVYMCNQYGQYLVRSTLRDTGEDIKNEIIRTTIFLPGSYAVDDKGNRYE